MRVFIFMCLLAAPLQAELHTYSYPDAVVPETTADDGGAPYQVFNIRSERYAVQVSQDGSTQDAYVMHSNRPHPSGNLSLNPHAHWTNFSCSGEVTVTVQLPSGDITSCAVYPERKGVTPRVTGNQAVFDVTMDAESDPLQLYVRMNADNEHALFVFIDPLETDVPDRDDTGNVEIIRPGEDIQSVRNKLRSSKPYAVFKEGVHQWGGGKNTGYDGYQMPIESGKKIYIPGGAYVIGTFDGHTESNFKIYGRGVLSACGKDRLPGSESIPYSMLHSSGSGSGQVVEGIVSTDAPHFHLTFRGQVHIDNVKMMGWWHQVDGIVTGDHSTVENCFFKVNDDVMKIYSDHCMHRNNTIFQQVNGAPFQFCWGRQNGDDNVMQDTYIVGCVYTGGTGGTGNNAVINARNGSGAVTENNRWDGLYIDNGCRQLIGLDAENEDATIFRDFLIKNVVLNSGYNGKPQNSGSYLANGGAHHFDQILFRNLVIDGDSIHTANTGSDVDNDGSIWFWQNGGLARFARVAFESGGRRLAPLGDAVSVTVFASDLEADVQNVQLYLNGQLIGEKTQAPYEWTQTDLGGLSAGSYQLRAVVQYPEHDTEQAHMQLIIYDPDLPGSWEFMDVGSPGLPGYSQIANDRYLLNAGGESIDGRLDAFHYLYRRTAGDFEFLCRLDSFRFHSDAAIAGIMARQTLSNNTQHVSLLMQGDSGLSVRTRKSRWGGTAKTFTDLSAPPLPHWLRLSRSGDTFRLYHSNDGGVWTLSDSLEVDMNDSLYVGLALAGLSADAAAQAGFSQVSLQTLASRITQESASVREYRLYPAYPNPFNASTTIRYDMARSGRVRIALYSVRGQRIAVLKDANCSAGEHCVNINATDLASGMYFIRINSPDADFTASEKLLLLK